MLTANQRARAAVIIAEMAASMTTATTEDEQHGVAYLMQEFALMLLGEANMELAPSDKSLKAIHEVDSKLRTIIVSTDGAAVLLMDDDEVALVKKERLLSTAEWLKCCGDIDLECIT